MADFGIAEEMVGVDDVLRAEAKIASRIEAILVPIAVVPLNGK